MIAIPNMNKPKFCEDCFVPLSKCEYFAKNGIDHCPIIEIVRCGECIHHDDGLCHRPKWAMAVEPTDFCSYGERRNNENGIMDNSNM